MFLPSVMIPACIYMYGTSASGSSSHRVFDDTKMTKEYHRSSGPLALPNIAQRRHNLATPLEYLESVLPVVGVRSRSTPHCAEQAAAS